MDLVGNLLQLLHLPMAAAQRLSLPHDNSTDIQDIGFYLGEEAGQMEKPQDVCFSSFFLHSSKFSQTNT